MRLVRTAIMPQPMSTPTAAGMIAPSVGITLPTVAPMPECTSGMTATQRWMNGSRATLRELRARRVLERDAARPRLDRHAARRLELLVAAIRAQSSRSA